MDNYSDTVEQKTFEVGGIGEKANSKLVFNVFRFFRKPKTGALFAYAKLFSEWMNLYMFIKNILFKMGKCKLIGLLTLKMNAREQVS